MKFLKVNLWDSEIGRLCWDAGNGCTYFMYNPATIASVPDIAPILSPAAHRDSMTPVHGDERPMYHGLPPFISDSLPDAWGNTLFEKWIKESRIPRNKVTPLYKLMFIGSRGMGALEYEPAAAELNHNNPVDVKALYKLSLKVLEDREQAFITPDEKLTLQGLLSVGTSAGGRQMKAVVAIDDISSEIRSGQTFGLEGFSYFIMKFGSNAMPLAEIEMAYHEMARDAGIIMEECRLMPIEGVNHFLTRRFDRKEGKKLHVQTLAAINPEARSYEDLLATCRSLRLKEEELNQIYRRMVFNVMANNTDDHTKNVSFLLREGAPWCLAPAYDMTFIFNQTGTGPNLSHRMSLETKTSEISKSDLLDFAMHNDIPDASAVIDEVAEVLSNFDAYAERNCVWQPWRGIIQKSISSALTSSGSRKGLCATL